MKILFALLISATFSFASDVLVDKETGLMWQDNFEAKHTKKNWDGAMAFCKHLTLVGHDDWRLANVKELKKLVSTDPRDGGIKKGFKNFSASGYYWSSDTHDDSDEFAWMMNFKRGYEYSNYKTYERHIRCVRDVNTTL
jgi:hypothetical protein